jgi:YgiT-type zinc finger domain-containing protein
MKCALCHGQMKKKQGEIELRIHGKLYLVDCVSYQECSCCGERTLSPEISQDIFSKIKRKEFKEKHILLPVAEGCNPL